MLKAHLNNLICLLAGGIAGVGSCCVAKYFAEQETCCFLLSKPGGAGPSMAAGWGSGPGGGEGSCADRQTRTDGLAHRTSPSRRPLVPGPAGRSSRVVTRRMRVTAYCPCRKCCAPFADGITASGRPVSANRSRFAAGPAWLPLGCLVAVPGYAGGEFVPVLDRGGAIRGDRLDVFFPTHAEALRWGVRWLRVRILAAEDTEVAEVN